MSENFIKTNGLDDQEWPRAAKEAFLRLCEIADDHAFSVLCAVGFNRHSARTGNLCMTSFFSPRASLNPHQVEMLEDIAELFRRSVERSKQ
jgi:hypothetical protein